MQDRPLAAAAHVVAAMAVIGLIDQAVQVIARDGSLWTFHLLRTAMIWAMAVGWLAVSGARPRVVSWRAVTGRSALMASALTIYFGALGFLSVAQAAAGLFTAPLFVALLSVAAGRAGRASLAAAGAGFAGVVLVLAPDPAAMGAATLVPVAAGAFYALGVLATRAWCAREAPLVLALGSFTALALWAAVGLAVATALGSGDGFLGRGWVAPTGAVWLWTAVQAAGSLLAVVLLTRGYLMAEASTVSVFEYTLLGFSALFGLAVWGDRLGPSGLVGLGLIAGAGVAIAWRERARGAGGAVPPTGGPDGGGTPGRGRSGA